MSVQMLKIQGFDCVKLSFNNYSATIMHGRGCNIIDFTETTNNLSLLHYPEEHDDEEFARSPQRFGSVMLFHPNRIRKGLLPGKDQLYDLNKAGIPISHGLVKEYSFDLVSQNETDDFIEIKFTFNSSSTPYYKEFGWLFEINYTYTLSSEGLLQEVSVTNKCNISIPFGFGYHTAFRIPQTDSFTKDDYTISVSSLFHWELDCEGFPTGNLIPLDNPYNSDTIRPLDYPISELIQADLGEVHTAIIHNQVTDHRFIYETDTIFKNWMIWNNNANCNYICIEPMSWIINAPNVPIDSEHSGFRYLEPSETINAKNKMYVKF